VHPPSGDGDESMLADETVAQPSSAMTQIARVDTMLELLPVSHDVKSILRRVLPVYNASDALSAEEMRSYFLSHSTNSSKEQLLADIPAPDSQSERCWRDLLAFEAEGRCARPSNSLLLSIWRSIIDYATLNRLDLTGEVDFTSFFGKEHATPVDAAPAPAAAVAEAIHRHLEDSTLPHSTASSLQLDRLKTVRWIGLALLQAHAEESAPGSFSLADYICQWQDLLPQRWREDAALEKLPEASYAAVTLDGDVTITWIGTDDSASVPAQSATPEATKLTAGKRKWHEKFKAQRKEIRK
jgi:sister chromatid cohesion protein DCC1